MTTDAEIKTKFWKALKSDMTIMLGLDGVEDGHARPMTAHVDEEANGEESGPLYIFTATDNGLVELLEDGGNNRAIATFASKGNDIFATIHGSLSKDNDRAKIDRLWNRFVAAWYEGGKDDPKLQLLRFDTEEAEVWVDASSMIAGIKMLIGIDPKKDYKDKIATVEV